MSTTLFSAFLPEVLPYVPDCPPVIAVNAVRNAAIEFCEKTNYWQGDVTSLSVATDPGKYLIMLPAGTVLVEVLEAWWNGRYLSPKSADELSTIYRGQDWRNLEGEPVYFTRIMPEYMRVVPQSASNVMSALSMRAAVAPARNATGIDSLIYQRQLETISMGARARLHAIADQSFTDMANAALERKAFLTGIGTAKIQANKGLTRASNRIEFRPF